MNTNIKKIQVWDLPLRLFHWLLTFCVFGSIISAKTGNFFIHERFGLGILSLILFRVLWGIIGSDTSKFVNFIRGPKEVIKSIRSIILRKDQRHFGHSAIAGWATLALLFITLFLSLTGSVSSNGILFDGPYYHFFPNLSSYSTKLHHLAEPVLYFLLSFHVMAMLIYYFWLKTNLVKPMFSGKAEIKNIKINQVTKSKNNLGIILLLIFILSFQFSTIFRDEGFFINF